MKLFIKPFIYSLFFLFLSFSSSFCQKPSEIKEELAKETMPEPIPETHWADSVMEKMTLEEKIGQLIMVAGYSNRNKAYENELSELINKYQIGGVIFFQGGPVRQVNITNRLQSEARIPLLVGIDGEWGLEMRLDSTMAFPYQMGLGAIQDDSLVYDMGVAIAKQLNRIGVHLNFAPVVDINNNPKNPVINYRSFGEEKENVAKKGIMYMKGMQDNHIITSAKHFPGHGDTDKDSHKTLPLIQHDRQRLEAVELYPFRELISAGVKSIMVGHLNIPALDPKENQAASLSKPIVTGLLKEELGYKGLVITDAMNMKGVADRLPPGEVDVQVLLAGNDMILMPTDVSKTIVAIKKAIEQGKITKEDIDKSAKKVLEAKYWAGVHKFQPIDTENLVSDLNLPEDQLLKRKLLAASLTLLKNEKQLLPLKNLDTLKVATISIGTAEETVFQKTVQKYKEADHFSLPENSSKEMIALVEKQLEKYNLLLVSMHRKETRPGTSLNLTTQMSNFLKKTSSNNNTVFVLFRNAYLLDKYPGFAQSNAVIVAYQGGEVTEEVTAEAIFGALGMNGKLPVSANTVFKAGDGLKTKGGIRLGYAPAEAVGISSSDLTAIDTLAFSAIKESAIPGCVVLVAKDGQVIYNKAFGYHTYDSVHQVQSDDIYDLASITKIAAALPALMKLYAEGKFDLDEPISKYLKEFKRKDKKDITFREVLVHQGGLTAWIPFWQNTIKKNGRFKWFTFKADSSKRFPYKVAEHLYLNRNYHKKIYKAIRKSSIATDPQYVYSDLSFYLYPKLVEKLTGTPFLTYIQKNFYEPLGAGTLTYNPYEKFPIDRIVPTEYDSLFRKKLIHGRVHDEGAAMLNGVSGHAGLFGNANDLAKMMQMYLQYGSYGNQQYIDSSAFIEFTKCQFCEKGNRRAIGFDRPIEPYVENGNTAQGASSESFGHSGFTGTFTWIDPKFNLVYIFLSNRVYPTRENTLLYALNIRTRIQQVIYDALD